MAKVALAVVLKNTHEFQGQGDQRERSLQGRNMNKTKRLYNILLRRQ